METTPVPTYKLFGEQELWPNPEPVHHETISARSVLHDWEITAHSHADLLQILLVRAGAADMTLETETFGLEPPCLLMIPPGCVHGFRFAPGTIGQILSLPRAVLDELLRLSPALKGEFTTPGYCRLAEDEADYDLLQGYFDRFAAEYNERRLGRLSALMNILGLILIWLARSSHGLRQADHQADRFRQRLDRFLTMIDGHFRERRPVAFYADRLGVSTAQLNNTCRREAGSSAQDLIHQRVLLEARRLLAYSDLDITSIGYALGFNDSAYFSRFFTRKQGLSPSQFRERHGRRGVGH